MFDFFLGVAFSVLAIRGWSKAAESQVFEFAAVVGGIAIAFRIAGPIGDAFAARFGSTPETARIVTSVVVLVLVTAGLLTLGRALVDKQGSGRKIPRTRLAGAALAVVTGVLAVMLLASVVRAIPGVSGFQRGIEGSAVVQALIPPEGPGESIVTFIAGDPVMRASLAMQPEFGAARVVLVGEPVLFAPADRDRLTVRPDVASVVGDLVVEARVGSGVDPMAWSAGLAGVAEAYALDLYQAGTLTHHLPDHGEVADRVARASISLFEVDEVVAMAASGQALHRAVLDVDATESIVVDGRFDRFGVGVVEGPSGLLMVEVFGR